MSPSPIVGSQNHGSTWRNTRAVSPGSPCALPPRGRLAVEELLDHGLHLARLEITSYCAEVTIGSAGLWRSFRWLINMMWFGKNIMNHNHIINHIMINQWDYHQLLSWLNQWRFINKWIYHSLVIEILSLTDQHDDAVEEKTWIYMIQWNDGG